MQALTTTPDNNYATMLNTAKWRVRRNAILERDLHTCRNCGSKKGLQVHHRQYHFLKELQTFRKPWEYEDRLLITLCRSCHLIGHAKYKVPTIYI